MQKMIAKGMITVVPFWHFTRSSQTSASTFEFTLPPLMSIDSFIDSVEESTLLKR